MGISDDAAACCPTLFAFHKEFTNLFAEEDTFCSMELAALSIVDPIAEQSAMFTLFRGGVGVYCLWNKTILCDSCFM